MSFTLHRSSERRLVVLFLLAVVVFVVALWRRPLTPNTPTITPTALGTEAAIASLQTRLQRNPDDAQSYAQLGLAYLERVRQTADPQLYTLAEQAFSEALNRDDQQLEALIGQGMLALSRHEFEQALVWGEQARVINPYRAQILGILVDANVELGRYEVAVEMAQAMVDLRPDLASYSRISYLRELHGDVDGAIEAMQTAVSFGAPTGEQTAWTRVQLGNLYLHHGDVDRAETIYQETLYYYPDYAYALAGLGNVQAARGEYGAAINAYQPLVERLPLPQFAITLGELYEANGQEDLAGRQYELVRIMQQLNAKIGMAVDLELALFEADHGDTQSALALAQAAYGRRPNIYAADALAWALYQMGDYEAAWQYSQEALRLGTRDMQLHYHAGKIALALGMEEEGRRHLETAVFLNRTFPIPYSLDAQALLSDS